MTLDIGIDTRSLIGFPKPFIALDDGMYFGCERTPSPGRMP